MKSFAPEFALESAPKVKTTAGIVQGFELNGVRSFLGIPYGEARSEFGAFGPLSEEFSWQGVLDCNRLPDVFPQPISRLASVMGPAIDDHEQSSTAFTVNVFSPLDASPDDGLPVMVFVHGGAFLSGGGGVRWYDGAPFVRRAKAVVVTINYRLGMWGHLVAEGAPSNNAVRDVIAALKWVAKNIAAFGGNPKDVTIAGQSAGAIMCRLMTICPDAKGLFHRAILLSCPGVILAPKADAGKITERVMGILGARDVRELAKLSAQDVIRASAAVSRETPTLGLSMPIFRPVADGELLHDWADDPMVSASYAHCHDIMVGYTREEMAAFFWRDADSIDPDVSRVLAWYEEAYGGERGLEVYRMNAARRLGATPYTQWVDGMSDQSFALPSIELCSAYAEHGRAWLFRLDLQTAQPHLLSPHCLDLPFVFNNVDHWYDAPMLEGMPLGPVKELAERMSDAIARFVRDGKPGVVNWVPFTDATPCVMSFDRSGS